MRAKGREKTKRVKENEGDLKEGRNMRAKEEKLKELRRARERGI
jgi:hypothetical protein